MPVEPVTEIQVQDVMTRDVLCVGPLTSIGEALDLMFEARVSALPVVDDANRCFGIVTVTDLVVLLRSTEQALKSDYLRFDDYRQAITLVLRRLDSDPVRNVMSELMVSVAPEVSLGRAAKTMADENVHHLPVIADRKLVGFLSSSDIVRVVAENASGGAGSHRERPD